jgi:hypothetical protein
MTCKEQFTSCDVRYIANVLGQDEETVADMLFDPETASDFMSGNSGLIRHVIMYPGDDISIRLFTYAAMRVALVNDRHRANDERLTDFAAELAVRYVEDDDMHRPAVRLTPFGYICNQEKKIMEEGCRDRRMEMHLKIALFTLCLLGINPERISQKEKPKMKVDMVEKNGKRHLLSAIVLCNDPDRREILELLASFYCVTRLSYNLMAEHCWLPVRDGADVWNID